MSPRQQRIQDLLRARIELDQQIDKLAARTYRKPRARKTGIRRTGRMPSIHGPEVGWREQARVNLLELDRMHAEGDWHSSHRKGGVKP